MADIICFWDRHTRLWTLYCVDAEGNQLWEAQHFPNRATLARWLSH